MLKLSARKKAETLWEEMRQTCPPYPKDVAAIPEPITGTAFFPGGLGLWFDETGDPEWTAPRIMVVGQDFNTVAAYERAHQKGSEVDTSRTWQNMRTVFPKLGLPMRDCFFTNFYMGLRERGPETGRFPGARDKDFVQRCARFFERQMEVMRPQLIVTLGTEALRAVGKHVFQVPTPKTLAACVDVSSGLNLPHGRVAFAALTHPSLYFANVHGRRFMGLTGMDAERAMIQSVGCAP